MKVILTDYVKSLGNPGDEVKVADGYARNYLIPKSLAVAATEGNKTTFNNNLKQRARKLAKAMSEAETAKAAIEGLETLVFTRKAGSDGKLFGSVTGGDIEDALKEHGVSIDRKKLGLAGPIKHLGEEVVSLWLHAKVSAGIRISVVAEAAEEIHAHEEAPVEETAEADDDEGE